MWSLLKKRKPSAKVSDMPSLERCLTGWQRLESLARRLVRARSEDRKPRKVYGLFFPLSRTCRLRLASPDFLTCVKRSA